MGDVQRRDERVVRASHDHAPDGPEVPNRGERRVRAPHRRACHLPLLDAPLEFGVAPDAPVRGVRGPPSRSRVSAHLHTERVQRGVRGAHAPAVVPAVLVLARLPAVGPTLGFRNERARAERDEVERRRVRRRRVVILRLLRLFGLLVVVVRGGVSAFCADSHDHLARHGEVLEDVAFLAQGQRRRDGFGGPRSTRGRLGDVAPPVGGETHRFVCAHRGERHLL
mmetsp:Transcript_3736/g.15835  ORF Transcript_3736/g.15835 Transcript_3736/m.15835 type:complete len:224 (-) Transcript_3736:501-1172(-)